MLSRLVNTCDQQNDTWKWIDMSNLKSLPNGKTLPRGWDSCMWPVDLLSGQVTRWVVFFFFLKKKTRKISFWRGFGFRLVNSLSKMYLKSDVQLLPSTLRPNYLHSRQRSLPRCNIYIVLVFFFLYAYIHDKLSDHFLDIFLLVLPWSPPTGTVSRYPACCSWDQRGRRMISEISRLFLLDSRRRCMERRRNVLFLAHYGFWNFPLCAVKHPERKRCHCPYSAYNVFFF